MSLSGTPRRPRETRRSGRGILSARQTDDATRPWRQLMVIVGGSFELEPSDRDQLIASRVDMMQTSRDEPGCIEYTFSADAIGPRRVVLFERWESQDALDAHLNNLRGRADARDGVAPITASITIYDVVGERQLGR